MSKLEFVGTKIPSEWIQKLKQLAELTGKNQSAIVRDAIAAAIGINDVIPVNPLRSELDDLKARVLALEELTQLSMVNQKQKTEVNQVKPIAVTTTSPVTKSSTQPTGLMRSGELLVALQARGYTRSAGSLLRDLNESIEAQAPNKELERFGVRFDFEAKRLANPRSSNLRWLWIED